MGKLAAIRPAEASVVRCPYRSSRDGEVLNDQFFEPGRVEELCREFVGAYPWPHLVLDHLFKDEFLAKIVQEFSEIELKNWLTLADRRQFKFATQSDSWLPPSSQTYFDVVNSGPFVRYLSKLTGVEELIVDAGLTNGGLHQIQPGGHFALHIDNQLHPINRLNTRLTVITYLNRDWRPEFGGALELRKMDAPAEGVDVQPVFGRTIIFLNTPTSLHGHPDPVTGPKTLKRRSLATYYYTNSGMAGRPDPETAMTAFPSTGRASGPERLRLVLKKLAPPIVGDTLRLVRKTWAKRALRRD